MSSHNTVKPRSQAPSTARTAKTVATTHPVKYNMLDAQQSMPQRSRMIEEEVVSDSPMPPGAIQYATARVRAASERLGGVVADTCRLADRICGPQDSDDCRERQGPDGDGQLSELARAITEMERTIDAMQSQLDRLLPI